ncbi:MAG: acetoin dehydrogenase [Pigmentiphaga sp.]|nr:acetoin dehydrogenase [Pigmentiphaga sp.]
MSDVSTLSPTAEAVATQVESLTYAKAINAALARALEQWPEALLYGEDLAKPGGVFGVTRGLQERFGAARVFDTPISETAMLGAAVGAAMTGARPIVEIMWMDFTLVATDQIVNQAANVRYVSAGRLSAPLVIRTQQGALPGSCAQHSQNLEAWFAHVPGLRVGLPATPQDAHDMLLSAVACDDPVMVIEHRGLYHGEAADVALEGPIAPVGGARVRRPGSDVTLLSWGAMANRVQEAASVLAAEGIEAEVIDARWVAPMDWQTVLDSVRRTRRLLVIHEANLTGGVGAEVAAVVQERLFGELAAPVRRLATPDLRMPAAPHLQDAAIPDVTGIVAAARELVKR